VRPARAHLACAVRRQAGRGEGIAALKCRRTVRGEGVAALKGRRTGRGARNGQGTWLWGERTGAVRRVPVDIGLMAAVGGIVLVDLTLSGDNVLVIAAAAARLPTPQRRQALLWGALGALLFRLLLTTAATELLTLPLVRAIGGVLVLVVAVRLLLPGDAEPAGVAAPGARAADARFLFALLTIVIADATMSLDNVLAIGALASGNIPLLAVGLLLSMGLLFVASSLVAAIIRRLPWLMDVAAVVLAWTAAHLLVHDPWLMARVPAVAEQQVLVYLACVDLILAVNLGLRVRRMLRARGPRQPAARKDAAHRAVAPRERVPR
jgi:YjbE family integral membrane protein